jgi:hypothetical protein
MNMTFAAAIILAATTARAAALSSDAPPPGPLAEAAILQIECETVAAHLTGDAEKLDRIWADEYGRFLLNGAVLAKADYLAGLRSGRIQHDVLEVASLTVQVFGDFAFASGRARVQGQDGTVTFNGLDGFLTVYHLWHGGGQAITTHAIAPPVSTPLVVDADAASPYLLPCDTPEEFCSIDEDIYCQDVSRAPGTGSSTRLRRR